MKTVILVLVVLVVGALCATAWTDERARKIVSAETSDNQNHRWGRSWNITASVDGALSSRSVHDKHGSVMVDVIAEDWDTIQAIDGIKRSGVARTPTAGTYRMKYSTALRMAESDRSMRLLLDDESARAVGLQPGYGGGDTNDYPAPEAAYEAMRKIAHDHPEWAQLHHLGKSTEGVDMVAVCMHKKSGAVAVDEPVPTVVWLQQHGKEYIAYQMAIMLAEAFTKSAADGDAVINEHLATIRTCFLPTANPDGIKHFRREVVVPGGDLVDPNRNFPYTEALKAAGRKAGVSESELDPPISHENVILMAWIRRIGAHAIWALHGGARGVFSIPRDSAPQWAQHRPYHDAPMRTEDDKAVRAAAGVWTSFSYDFKNNRQFPKGMVNGNQWYPAKGSLCDWAEEELGITLCGFIELGPKVPTIDMVQAHYFRSNWQSFVRENAMVMRSFRARVVDKETGAPVEAKVGVVRYRQSTRAYTHDGASSLFDHDGSMNSRHARAVTSNPHTGFVLKPLPPVSDGYMFHVYVGAEHRSAKVFTVDVYSDGERPIDEITIEL